MGKGISLKRSREFIFLVEGALVLLLGLGLRLIAYRSMPAFIDEAMFVEWGSHIRAGDLFYGMQNSRWLYTFITSLMGAGRAEGLYLNRLVALISSPLAAAVAIRFGRELVRGAAHADRLALASGLVYALMPMALLHERLAMYESLMNSLTMAGALAALLLMRQPGPRYALVCGLALAGGAATKINAMPYLALPLLAWLLMPVRPQRGRAALWALLALALALGLVALLNWAAAASGVRPFRGFEPNASTTLLGGLTDPATRARIGAQAAEAWQAWQLYFGWPLLLLAISAPFWPVPVPRPAPDSRPLPLLILYLLGLALAFAPAPILIDQPTSTENLPARYFVFSAAPLAALAAYSLLAGIRVLRQRAGLIASRILAGVLLALLLIPYLRFDLILLTDFDRARLDLMTDFDELQYSPFLTAWAREDLARVMLDQQAQDGRFIRLFAPEADLLFFQAMIGPRLGGVEIYREGDAEQAARAQRWLAQGDAVYLLENAFSPLPADSLGLSLTQVGEASFEDWTFRLYRARP